MWSDFLSALETQSPAKEVTIKCTRVGSGAAVALAKGTMQNKSVRVVMIDDDEDDFRIVKDLLARGTYNTYEPIWISNFEDGLERLKREDGDVFLLDYHLGRKTGLSLLEEAGAKSLSKPVIMLTGVEDPEVDLSAMEAGAAYFVPKASLLVDHLLERTIRYATKRAEDFKQLRNIDRLRIEKQAAESASYTKSLFLAGMSHEFRTPLAAILGYTELAKESKRDEEKERYLNIIDRNSKHLLTLVNDLLDLAKIEAGKYEVTIAPCNWREVVREVIDTLRVNAAKRGNEIRFVDSEPLPDLLLTDAKLLRQILINLVGNASKFTERGWIEVRAESGADFKLLVQDTGIGISNEQQSQLFQPFSQGHGGLQKKFEGTSLGLQLSRRMAQSLNGDLTLYSTKLGDGSTFAVTLPSQWSHTPAPKNRDQSLEQSNLQGLSVLLAEDSEDNQFLVRHYLSSFGASVEVADNGRIALCKAREFNYDVILMDIQMPEMDGIAATKAIRSSGIKTPIVALSAHAMSCDRKKALDMGFSAYLTKPIQSRKLINVLASYIRSH